MGPVSTGTRSARAGVVAACLLGLLAPLLAAAPAPPGRAEAPTVEVLSNRADAVSAGDVRVAVDVEEGTDPDRVRVSLDGRDVSEEFAWRPNGRYEALLTGLDVGEHEIVARAGGPADSVTLVNHPNGGPVLSGPHVEPWTCQEGARDEQCNQPPEYEYRYKSSVTGQWHDYDPDDPPPDVDETTTDEGHTVPFVIRVETGYQNRDQYRIATLYDPEDDWEPWDPQETFNHKLLVTHGASCGTSYEAGSAPAVTGGEADEALGRGFAVMSTALNNAGHNCNVVTQAESLVMAKERVVERYGDLRYTIGTGCSGGSLTQQQVANAYPGIYQGILPACSFPDAWSTGPQLVEYHLLNSYFHDPARWGTGVAWDPAAISAVEGHPNHVNSVVFESAYWTSLGDPTSSCPGLDDEQVYDPDTNPTGVRCTLQDYMINVFGPRRPEDWGPVEQELGRGFAGVPLDNVGVQYGLEALEQGRITPEQFVDLNREIGGLDIDAEPRDERYEADRPALERAYRSGAVNTAEHLDQVAIIDLRGPDHGVFHDAYRSWAVRARLEREHGHADNHVIWMGHVPLIGDPDYTTEGLVAMDRWLAAVEADASDRPLAERIVDNRPADVQDRCSQIEGVEALALPGLGRVCEHEHLQSRYATPRMVAGDDVSTDTLKCELEPHRRQDYYPVTFTDEQWERLDAAFPRGVCDWSEPGVGRERVNPWQTYFDDDGEVLHGGRPLGDAPEGSGTGWTSPAFAAWRQTGTASEDDARPGRRLGR